MSKPAGKIFPGARLFENALASLGRSQAQCRKPKTLGLKEIKHPESASEDSSSSPTEIREASIPVFQNRSSVLFEETHNSTSIKAACRAKESSLQTATTKKDECSIPMSQQRPPPGFVPSNVYSPLNYQVHPSTASYDFSSVPEMHSTDSYTYTSKAPTSYSIQASSSSDNLQTPINYLWYSRPLPAFLTPLPSPPSNKDNAFYFNSPYSLSTPISHEELRQSLLSLSITDLNPSCSPSSRENMQQSLHSVSATDWNPNCIPRSHEEMRESLYSMTATDLALQMYGKLPDSPSDCTLPLNSQDSGCQLSDDNDSSETSTTDSDPFTGMSYYHIANTPELISTEKQIIKEVPPVEKRQEPKQASNTLTSGRVNRRNVNRIQGANTCISSGVQTLRINRANLPKSVVKYSSPEDSGADVSMDESLSPSYPECRGCETLSKRVSLADTQRKWKALPDYGGTNFLSLKCKPGFIDSHCHLDFLLVRQNYKGTYSEYMQKHKGTYPASYEGCVAVFCHPHTFNQRYMWQKYLGENGVWGAFGCHPHHSKFYNTDVERHLKQAIQHSKVRALGEIGLDYSDRNNCSFETQYRVFRRQLQIALDEQLPLVIHCRDANEDTMRIMKEILPRDYIIHLHCFTDGWDWAQKWMKEFPNLCIGITNLVTFASATPTHDVVKKIPLDRLLLETDAPYFIPRKVANTIKNTRRSHPGMAIHVAAQIAALRGVSLEEIIHHTRQNTTKVYGI